MMRFISFYNLLFFCLSQTADSNRRLGYSEYKYPSNDTVLRSFYFSVPVDITHFTRNSNFLLLPQQGSYIFKLFTFCFATLSIK